MNLDRLRGLFLADGRPLTEERQAFWRRFTIVGAAIWLIDGLWDVATGTWGAGAGKLVIGVATALVFGNRRYWAWMARRANRR